MRKVYKKLTEDQIKRGVIFSSCLSIYRYETINDIIHEVFKDQENKAEEITLLKDDRFFNSSHWKFNIIRQ